MISTQPKEPKRRPWALFRPVSRHRWMYCVNCVTQKAQWLIFGKRGQPWRSGIVALSGLRSVKGSNLMCQKNFGISGILNCVRKICGLAGVTYYQKNCVVCGACWCAPMASLICADDCSAAVAAFACITPISSIVNAINLAFVLFVIAKIIGLVVLCFRYQ